MTNDRVALETRRGPKYLSIDFARALKVRRQGFGILVRNKTICNSILNLIIFIKFCIELPTFHSYLILGIDRSLINATKFLIYLYNFGSFCCFVFINIHTSHNIPFIYKIIIFIIDELYLPDLSSFFPQ